MIARPKPETPPGGKPARWERAIKPHKDSVKIKMLGPTATSDRRCNPLAASLSLVCLPSGISDVTAARPENRDSLCWNSGDYVSQKVWAGLDWSTGPWWVWSSSSWWFHSSEVTGWGSDPSTLMSDVCYERKRVDYSTLNIRLFPNLFCLAPLNVAVYVALRYLYRERSEAAW